jgi:hypothetical protein
MMTMEKLVALKKSFEVLEMFGGTRFSPLQVGGFRGKCKP